MSEILIKNGHVFDVVSGVKGDKADIAIKDGKIVDKVSSKAKTIDASGKTVMAGALDIHAHVAGPKVNLGRWFRPEDKMIRGEMRGGIVKQTTRMEQGFSFRPYSEPDTHTPVWGTDLPWKQPCHRSMHGMSMKRSRILQSSMKQHFRVWKQLVRL